MTKSSQSEAGLPPGLFDEPAALDANTLGQRRKLGVIGGIFALLFLLATLVPIGGAVVGAGQIGIASKIKRIAHPTGGVIAEIAVSNGEHVRAGQLLMRLDDSVSGADARYSSQTVEQLLAQRGRLEAEQIGAGAIRFPLELTGNASASARQAMADESRLFALRASELVQLRAQLSSRAQQYSDQIAGFRAQIASLQRQRELIEPERRATAELAEKQLVTISRVNQLERTAAELDGNIASLHAQIASAQAQISEAREQSVQVVQSRRAEAGRQLAEVNTALNQQQVRSVAATDQQTRSEIRAPYAGTVEKIAFAAIGDVVRPAEPIMEIVPDADQLVVEAMVSPDDVDQVRIGQPATVRFSSLNRSATPEISGRVSYVATDRTEDPQTKATFFVTRIAIDQRTLQKMKLNLRSGTPAEVHIQTGDRSLLSYIFKPLSDQFARAFRDN